MDFIFSFVVGYLEDGFDISHGFARGVFSLDSGGDATEIAWGGGHGYLGGDEMLWFGLDGWDVCLLFQTPPLSGFIGPALLLSLGLCT
jgi:hypothetical protein